MLFDFAFSKVSFVEQVVQDAALVVPYNVVDEKVVFPKKWASKFKNIEGLLAKKTGSLFSTYISGSFYMFVCIKEKDTETHIVSAVKSIPNSMKNICIDLRDSKFYDKLLVSKIIYETKQDWNLKTDKDKKEAKNISLIVKDAKKHSELAGCSLGESQALVQQLVNMPSNYLTPTKFGEIVQEYIKSESLEDKIVVEVHGKSYIEEQKMGSYLGVAKGSKEEPKLIVLKYHGAESKNVAPVVLVGKGLTFDSGGISIKPSLGMDAMKGDMAGAATAIGSIIYAAKNNLPINMVTIAACCENMPSGEALKPGDVVTAMDGTTIEVLDTDAEGRLVLADALSYSKQFEGKYTIDFATLTGACIVALGYIHTGLFTKEDKLAEKLISAGKTMKDLAWQLPLDEAHEEMLESKIADMSNLCIGKGAGAQNGAIFLKKFAPKHGWCHLDIAGTSAQKGGVATSRPMAMMSEFLDNL